MLAWAWSLFDWRYRRVLINRILGLLFAGLQLISKVSLLFEWRKAERIPCLRRSSFSTDWKSTATVVYAWQQLFSSNHSFWNWSKYFLCAFGFGAGFPQKCYWKESVQFGSSVIDKNDSLNWFRRRVPSHVEMVHADRVMCSLSVVLHAWSRATVHLFEG